MTKLNNNAINADRFRYHYFFHPVTIDYSFFSPLNITVARVSL